MGDMLSVELDTLLLAKLFPHQPSSRGGHQLCVDAEEGFIYLFGGWDGKADLGDFWQYSIREQTWFLLSSDPAQQGGPSARSCHKMCLDEKNKQVPRVPPKQHPSLWPASDSLLAVLGRILGGAGLCARMGMR